MPPAIRACLPGWAVIALVVAAGAQGRPGTAADFDLDGQVDADDLALLRAAVGTTEARFDLDGSGRVDTGDLFRFADAVAGPFPSEVPAEPPAYEVRTTRRELAASLPDYRVHVRHGPPFGIASLRMRGQRVDFAQPDFVLADWEWLWYTTRSGAKRSFKLLDRDWGAPVVRTLPDRLEVAYRTAATRRGIRAEVLYVFLAGAPSFRVVFTIVNGSSRPLRAPYAMLGFPGFSNQAYVTEVADAERVRVPRWPHGVFRTEAVARAVAEYLLLRHEVRPGHTEGMKGSVTVRDGETAYRLTSYFLSDPGMRQVFSAHTNKPRYLTSHLYATLADLLPGERRSLTIHYVMTRE